METLFCYVNYNFYFYCFVSYTFWCTLSCVGMATCRVGYG